MEDIFNKNSWKIDNDLFGIKHFSLNSSSSSDNLLNDTKLKYLNSIHYDEEVRIDVTLVWNITLFLNGKEFKINTDKLESRCILIKKCKMECGNDVVDIPENNEGELSIQINRSTSVKSFKISQDCSINNCNPNN